MVKVLYLNDNGAVCEAEVCPYSTIPNIDFVNFNEDNFVIGIYLHGQKMSFAGLTAMEQLLSTSNCLDFEKVTPNDFQPSTRQLFIFHDELQAIGNETKLKTLRESVVTSLDIDPCTYVITGNELKDTSIYFDGCGMYPQVGDRIYADNAYGIRLRNLERIMSNGKILVTDSQAVVCNWLCDIDNKIVRPLPSRPYDTTQ